MPTDSYTPDQAAAMVGTSPTSIRNWCKDFAGHLSVEANPQPGQKRRLTQQDVAKLQQVKLWRNNGRSTDEIATLLQVAATANEPTHLTIDVAPTPPTTAQDAHSDDLLLPVALSAMQSQLDALRRDHEAHIARMEAQRSKDTSLLITGMVIGGAVVLAVVAVVLNMV